jgi:hypothetical protein
VVSVTDPYGHSRFFGLEPLLFLPSSSSIVFTRLSEPRSRPTISQKNLVAPGIEPGPLDLIPGTARPQRRSRKDNSAAKGFDLSGI